MCKPALLALSALVAGGLFAADYPNLAQGDFVIRDFRFQSGESLPELRLHYTTIGAPRKDSRGVVSNAVLVLHGTGGSGARLFEREAFSSELFAPGQPLDAARYYVIFPDNIGHGGSSKPSDGLRTKFPHYGYADMVIAQRRLLTEKLGVSHLRLVIGTSMGCMHAWMWGGRDPDFADALMPLACLPYPITGRNLIWRTMVVNLVRGDPAYHAGNYTGQPAALAAVEDIQFLMTANPIDLQARGATRAEAETLFEKTMKELSSHPIDANDYIYQVESSSDYDPRADLDKIRAAVTAINFADDPINPAQLGIFERETAHVKRVHAILFPASEKTRGHSTHSMPALWKRYLVELLGRSEPGGAAGSANN
jgi:homoserine O-acetyltransferase